MNTIQNDIGARKWQLSCRNKLKISETKLKRKTPIIQETVQYNGSLKAAANKYERYYGPGRRPLAYLLYYIPTVSPACA